MSWRDRPWLVDLLVVALLAAVFVPISLTRLVDADEGTFLIVSRLTMEGETLYHDFHYPQMPLLPHVYGFWMRLFGPSWYAARLLSSFVAILLGWLLFRHVARIAGGRVLGVVAALVLASSTLAFAWYSTVKTLGLATLLVFAAYAVLYEPRLGRWRYAASGLLLGLATDVRIYVVALAPLLALSAVADERPWRDRLQDVVSFAVGLCFALLPTEYYALLDARLFYFNIIGHHAVRTSFGLVGWPGQKLDVVLTMLGVRPFEGVASLQFSALALLDTALAASVLRARQRPPLALVIAAGLSAVSLVPTPSYTQYFAMVLPFMIVAACLFVAGVRAELILTAPPALRRRLACLGAMALTAYVVVAPADIVRYTVDGTNVAGVYVPSNASNWTIPMIREVGRAVDELMPPGQAVALSFWPGYFVETRARIIPGLENHFAPMIARDMTVDAARQHQLMSYGELMWHLERHTAPVVVLGNWSNRLAPGAREQYQAALARGGYVLSRRLSDAELYIVPGKVALK
jgi:4-amino-4-deoxy-L-arabinose transferase-like glycosyltransferase